MPLASFALFAAVLQEPALGDPAPAILIENVSVISCAGAAEPAARLATLRERFTAKD